MWRRERRRMVCRRRIQFLGERGKVGGRNGEKVVGEGVKRERKGGSVYTCICGWSANAENACGRISKD